MITEAQQRFLKAISDRVTRGRVAEVRLFPTMRTGQVDSGVAIVAVADMAPAAAEPTAAQSDAPSVVTPAQDAETSTPSSSGQPADSVETSLRDGSTLDSARLSILTARFRHTVKGPDRGKWEFDIVHDADAPLDTVEHVVRGVARRAGEDGEPDLITGEDFQRALVEPWWTAPA